MEQCCICFENTYKTFYNCSVCVSGKICYNCILEIDIKGVCYIKDKEEIKKIITCPYCRTENYKYVYSMIIGMMLEDVVNQGFYDKPVMDIMIRNYHHK